ncbi:MAG TPA: hypothetical protein VG894_08015 [Bauldia sp.]|nr:hypothetical protein [Bauldia sp.]
MPRRIDFNVEKIEAVRVTGLAHLAGRDLMSPYVWKEEDGSLAMLVRVVEHGVRSTTGSIYYGTSTSGRRFTLHKHPAIAPGPTAGDIGGCEDPTVVKWRGRYYVYYTGVEETRSSGQMFYASGRSITTLVKQGIAHASTKTEGNTKEATIGRTKDGRWRMFYEYAHDDSSRVGLAYGRGVAGPWKERPAPFLPRKGKWDNWHLSTGPLLTDDPDAPVMFYNGATRDARWRIGWIAFDRHITKVVDRCIEPLIVPPPPTKRMGTDIAFAASVIVRKGRIHLYYSLEDRRLFRAIIRRS